MDLFYDGLYLGPAESVVPLNVTPGVNTIALEGRLLPYTTDSDALAKLGVLFSGYLNGVAVPVTAVGRSVRETSGVTPSWLAAAISALVLNVPLQSPTGPISPIYSISINAFSLAYTPETAYSPVASSPLVSAAIGLPFGFSLNITQAQNSIAIVQNGTLIAALPGTYGASTTMISDRNSGSTKGVLELVVPPVNLVVPNTYEGHLTLDQFQYDFAQYDGAGFYLNGTTNAVTATPIGQVLLTDVGFTVPSGLIGLSGLTKYPTLILSVDVTGGTPDYLLLNISVGLTNPSNLILSVGDVDFQLFTAATNAYLGRTILPSLTLTTGYQTHTAIGQFEANSNPSSLQALNDFTNGRDTPLLISGCA